ncbi:MAG: molybdopterin-binding protein [Candidatus Bathyarchaeota archaeon]
MFRKLLSFDEAKKSLNQKFIANPVGVEKVSLSMALNRVLAQNISATIDIPSFTRSTVDGYAVKAADTFEATEEIPKKLKFCGHVAIGESPKVSVKNGLAAEIVTGAPLPQGADSVVMIEYTRQQDDTILIHRPVALSENIMAAGSDIHKNEQVLKKGQIIDSRRIGVLAALGLTEIPVYKIPKVAILSTGEEIVEPGKPLSLGKIYDINAHTISAAVKEIGGEPTNLGIIPDNTNMLTKSIKKALKLADVVITSGGVSVGPKDITPKVVNSLGKPGVIISGVAVKPGKPITISVVNGKIIFSLPGNPTSSLFMFNMFIQPILTKLAGKPEEKIPTIRAITAKKMFPARGRRTFIMVNLTIEKSGKAIVNPVPTGLSGAITTLAKADGFIEISEKRQFLDEGEEIDVYLFGKI